MVPWVSTKRCLSGEGAIIIKPSIAILAFGFMLATMSFLHPAGIEGALAAQGVVEENNGRLFKRDYSVHPILGTTAGADLVKAPSINTCRALADIASDPNYFEHFKAEASAAQTFCDLILSGSLPEYKAPEVSDNHERRQDVLFGYNCIPVRISYLNGRIKKAEVRWRILVAGKFKSTDENTVQQIQVERAKQAISLRDSLIGKSKDEIVKLYGEAPLQLGYNDIWECRKDITANWFYWSGPLHPLRLAFSGETCFDACLLTHAQILDILKWRMCQFHGSKNSNVPANLAHCVLPVAGPQGKTISEIVAIYGKPQRIEKSGEQQKMIYPMAPNGYCELNITNGKCEEHVAMMVQTGGGGVPYSARAD